MRSEFEETMSGEVLLESSEGLRAFARASSGEDDGQGAMPRICVKRGIRR